VVPFFFPIFTCLLGVRSLAAFPCKPFPKKSKEGRLQTKVISPKKKNGFREAVPDDPLRAGYQEDSQETKGEGHNGFQWMGLGPKGDLVAKDIEGRPTTRLGSLGKGSHGVPEGRKEGRKEGRRNRLRPWGALEARVRLGDASPLMPAEPRRTGHGGFNTQVEKI